MIPQHGGRRNRDPGASAVPGKPVPPAAVAGGVSALTLDSVDMATTAIDQRRAAQNDLLHPTVAFGARG